MRKPIRHLNHGRRRTGARRAGFTVHGPAFTVALLVAGALVGLALPSGAAGTDLVPFRAAFCPSAFAGVNESDAKAAIQAWANSLVQTHRLNVAPEPQILGGLTEIREALRTRTCDYASLPTDDYFRLEPELRPASVCLSSVEGSLTETYILLVHAESECSSVADLAGHSLILFENVRASLARPWVEALLAESGLPSAESHFAGVSRASRLSQVVLPVFFHQADACLVTERGYRTMVELNPQVGVSLKTLAVSPPLVPSVAFFRPGYDPATQAKLENEIRSLNLTSAGRQVMNHFQCDAVEIRPASFLDSTREFLARRSLKGAGAGLPGAGATLSAPPTGRSL